MHTVTSNKMKKWLRVSVWYLTTSSLPSTVRPLISDIKWWWKTGSAETSNIWLVQHTGYHLSTLWNCLSSLSQQRWSWQFHREGNRTNLYRQLPFVLFFSLYALFRVPQGSWGVFVNFTLFSCLLPYLCSPSLAFIILSWLPYFLQFSYKNNIMHLCIYV